MFTFVFIDVRCEQLSYLLIKTIVNLTQNWLTMYMYFQNVYIYFFIDIIDIIFGPESHGFEYNIS